jgi:hypothetical protein
MHSESLRNLHYSSNVIMVIQLKGMRWMEYNVWEMIEELNILFENLKANLPCET